MKIKKFLKFYYGKINYLLSCIQWFIFLLIYKLKHKSTASFLQKPQKIVEGKTLLIAPHADDELLSSFTLLKRVKDITVYYCEFTGSNKSDDNKKKRFDEIVTLCDLMNISFISGDETSSSLKNAIVEGEFDVIVIPSIVDWHPQHRLVSYNLLDVIEEIKQHITLYSYSVTVPNESGREVLYMPLTKYEQEEKYNIFSKVYLSQSFMPLYRFQINERINGICSGSYAAEPFLIHPIPEWKCEVTRIRAEENSSSNSKFMLLAEELKYNLGKMNKIRSLSREMYKLVEENK